MTDKKEEDFFGVMLDELLHKKLEELPTKRLSPDHEAWNDETARITEAEVFLVGTGENQFGKPTEHRFQLTDDLKDIAPGKQVWVLTRDTDEDPTLH